MNLAFIITEKFLSLSFLIILQILVSWKFGTISYASLILTITLFSSLNIINVNSDLSFAKESKYDPRILEIYDMFAATRSLLLGFAGCCVYFFVESTTNTVWVLLILIQYICDAIASNRVLYNCLISKIHINIIGAFFRLIALSICYVLDISELVFVFCICFVNFAWAFFIFYQSPLKGFRIHSYFDVSKYKRVLSKFQEDIGYFHFIGYVTLLIGRFDILVYGYVSKPDATFALIGAISMAANTMGLVLASVMPLNLKAEKLNAEETFRPKIYAEYFMFSAIILGILSVLIIATDKIWLSIILPSLDASEFDYDWILYLSLLNVVMVRIFIQILMAFLIIKKTAKKILMTVVLPPLVVGCVLLVLAIQLIKMTGLELFLFLVIIKLSITLCWLFTSYTAAKVKE